MSGNNQILTPTTGESMHSFPATTSFQQDFTPHSAVSSFNLPARIDTNLYTPISMTNSPVLPIKTDMAMKREIEIKTSPTDISPCYDMFGDLDDGGFSPRYNAPMKPKQPAYQIAISGSGLAPESPGEFTTHPDPYYGSQYLVSAQAPPSRPSPSLSPHIQSGSGQNNDNHLRYQQTSDYNNTSFRPNTQVPTLIAPNPTTLRPPIARYRHNSVPSNKSLSAQPLHITSFPQGVQSGGKSGQKKKEPSYNDYLTVISNPELYVEVTDLERYILELRYKDGLQWKEVAKVFSRKHNKNTEVAALQMRRRRMLERLWERSCELAALGKDTAKWDGICKQLHKYAPRRSSKEVAQRKWNERNANPLQLNTQYGAHYSMQPQQRQRTSSDLTVESFDNESWSDGRESTDHSLHGSDTGGMMSAISSVAMGDIRSRAASDASLQLHLQQQQRHHQQQQQHRLQQEIEQQQQQDMLYTQQQQSGWGQRHGA
jgi:hypothetical protein